MHFDGVLQTSQLLSTQSAVSTGTVAIDAISNTARKYRVVEIMLGGPSRMINQGIQLASQARKYPSKFEKCAFSNYIRGKVI